MVEASSVVTRFGVKGLRSVYLVLASRFITAVTHVVTLIIPIINLNLLTKSPGPSKYGLGLQYLAFCF